MSIHIGKIVDTHPHGNSADVALLNSGAIIRHAQIMSHSAGTNYGSINLPEPTKTKDKFDLTKTKDRDIYCVVSTTEDGQSVVLGYIYDQVNQMAFEKDKYPNLRLDRHASDFVEITDNSGHYGLLHPSGTKIIIGSPPIDLTGKDFDKKWSITKNKKTLKSIVLDVPNKARVELNADGSASIWADNNTSVVALQGNVGISAGTSVNVGAGTSINMTAPVITLN